MKKQEEIQKINPYVSNRESILALPPPIINRLIARPNNSINIQALRQFANQLFAFVAMIHFIFLV